MKRVIKISAIALLTLVVLISITAVLLTYFINPNKFKGKISQLVFAKTGQVLVINGDMHWSFFPWVGIKAHNLSYFNAPGFQPKVLASAKEMDVKIKLIPLLSRQVEVGNITFDHLVVNLIKNKDGKFNWETITKTTDKKSEHHEKNQHDNHANTFTKMSIGSFKIKDGTVNWQDQKDNQKYTLDNFNLTSKEIVFNHAFPLSIAFTALTKNTQPLADINFSTSLTIDPDHQQYLMQNVKLKGDLYDKKYANGKINFSSNSDISIDLQKQIFSTAMSFTIANMEGKATINGRQIAKDPAINGDIKIDSFNLKNFLTELGKSDAPVENIALDSQVYFNNSNLKLDQMHLKVDDAEITGRTNIQLKNKNADFNLATQEIDLNKFISDKSANKTDVAPTDAQQPQSADAKPKASNNDWRVHGNIRIAKLTVKKLQLSNVTSTISYQNDIMQLSPIHADLYRGEANGSVIIDKRDNEKTSFTIKQYINSVDLKEMLQQVADSEKLSGTANITADLTSVTTANTNFLAALNGNLQLLVKNGALQGIDVTYQISRAHSFIKHLSKTKVENSKETQFQELTASAQITNGVLDNKDLIISSDYLKVNGQGSLNFDKNDISYYLKALARPKLAEDNQMEKEIITYEIPIKVSGSLAKPSVNLDFAELTKTIYQKQIQKPLQDHVGKNIQNLKDNLKEKIKNKLPLNILDKL